MRRLAAAIRFFTCLPLPAGLGSGEDELKGCLPFVPLVGLAIGSVCAGFDRLCVHRLPATVTCVLLVALLAAASRGLHLDGLTDTADGLLSARDRQAKLAIMRDSHIGAMGVLVAVIALALKVTALAALPVETRWRTVLLTPVVGRCAILVALHIGDYARPEGGLGALFSDRRDALLWMAAVAAASSAGWVLDGTRGIAGALAGLGVAVGLGLWTRRAIGGWTGDTVGASCELAEIAPAICACIGLGAGRG